MKSVASRKQLCRRRIAMFQSGPNDDEPANKSDFSQEVPVCPMEICEQAQQSSTNKTIAHSGEGADFSLNS